jgi:hypothetical protein
MTRGAARAARSTIRAIGAPTSSSTAMISTFRRRRAAFDGGVR